MPDEVLIHGIKIMGGWLDLRDYNAIDVNYTRKCGALKRRTRVLIGGIKIVGGWLDVQNYNATNINHTYMRDTLKCGVSGLVNDIKMISDGDNLRDPGL